MKVHFHPSVNSNSKISISNLANAQMVPYNQRTTPTLPNHISWDSVKDATNNTQNNKQTNRTKSRRKIFQPFQSTSGPKQQFIDSFVQGNNYSNNQALRKVKSTVQIETIHNYQGDDVQKRIQQINQQLRSHREAMEDSTVGRSYQSSKTQNHAVWIKIQQKLSESSNMLKKQEEVLTNKIPTFEKKIEENNVAIHKIAKLLQQKFDQQNRKVQKLVETVNKNQSELKIKDKELNRMNSQLQMKNTQLTNKQYQTKQKQLEVQRIRRIQQLQNKNLQLYQKLQKQKQKNEYDNRLQKFKDFIEENQQEDIDGGEEWETENSKFQSNRISAIKYEATMMNGTYSPNNTIGELLSPLALNQNQFVL